MSGYTCKRSHRWSPYNVRKHSGVIVGVMKDDNYPEFLLIHCIIHCEHLAAKYLTYSHVRKTVLGIVNFICTSANTHRQFRNFVEELDKDII